MAGKEVFSFMTLRYLAEASAMISSTASLPCSTFGVSMLSSLALLSFSYCSSLGRGAA